MALIRPFRALRPVSERVAQVASVPYDVINSVEARAFAKGNRWSLLHVTRSEIDLPEGVDPYSDQVYAQAESNFKQMVLECPLLLENRPSLYLYRLRMGQHVQTGIVGSFSVDEYDSNLIKKHEKTRKEKEDDRTRHIRQLSAQTGPVFLTYNRVSDIDLEVNRIQIQPPLYNFVADDSVEHTVWVVPNSDSIEKLFSERVHALYIADGHHRAAAASRVRSEMAAANPDHNGSENYNYFLAVAFPDNQLRILPYHRVVKDLGGMHEDRFIEKVKSAFEILPGDRSVPASGEFGMYLHGQWYRLIPKVKQDQTRLDVELLQDTLLQPVLGIGDPRTDKRIDFVGGIRGTPELERWIDQGDGAVAFSLHPTQLKDVMKISDQGGIMPPKSTWFEPKLRDGILIHYFGSYALKAQAK